MGMRATFAHRNVAGEVALTSIHWSTVIDATLGLYLNTAKNDGVELREAMGELVSAMSDYGHISAFQFDKEAKLNANDHALPHGAHLAMVQHLDGPERLSRATDTSAMTYSLDGDSLGLIYDESHPERVTFYWRDYDTTSGLRRRTVTLEELAAHYGQENPGLMSFRGLPRG